jgi:RNA polymerase sigma-70 factor (ECF subfamily)
MADAPADSGPLVGAYAAPRVGSDAEARATTDADVRALVSKNYDFVWRLLRRLGLPRHAADDAAQQVFVIASAKIGRIPQASRQSFLFGVALRVASQERRALRRRQRVIADPGEVLPDGISETQPKLRAVFVLYELEELTMAEIADLLRMPVPSVASRLRRARSDFERRLARHGLGHEGRGGAR